MLWQNSAVESYHQDKYKRWVGNGSAFSAQAFRPDHKPPRYLQACMRVRWIVYKGDLLRGYLPFVTNSLKSMQNSRTSVASNIVPVCTSVNFAKLLERKNYFGRTRKSLTTFRKAYPPSKPLPNCTFLRCEQPNQQVWIWCDMPTGCTSYPVQMLTFMGTCPVFAAS